MIKPRLKTRTLEPTRPQLCMLCGRKHDRQTVCLTDGVLDALADVWRSMELLPPE